MSYVFERPAADWVCEGEMMYPAGTSYDDLLREPDVRELVDLARKIRGRDPLPEDTA